MAALRLIRTMHPAGFRAGKWGVLMGTVIDPRPGGDRVCYVVEFSDGVTDFWVRDDPDGRYEFRDAPGRRRRI